MKFWHRLFGEKKPKETPKQSKYKAVKRVSADVLFATNFTEKGGRFLFSNSFATLQEYLNDILIENNWKKEDLACMDQELVNQFHLNHQTNDSNLSDKKVFLLGCEFLISNTGGVLVCNHQIKNFKKDDLPSYLIIYATVDQLVNDLSEGMSKINQKYAEKRPYNITSIEVKHLKEESQSFSGSTNPKTIYLLIEDI